MGEGKVRRSRCKQCPELPLDLHLLGEEVKHPIIEPLCNHSNMVLVLVLTDDPVGSW